MEKIVSDPEKDLKKNEVPKKVAGPMTSILAAKRAADIDDDSEDPDMDDADDDE